MKIMKNALASVATALVVFALSGCGASTTNTQGTQGTASSTGGSSQQSSEMAETSNVPPEAASKLHLKDGDTFPTFKATNISNDETVTNDVFKKNKVTVLSFWFNGCTACVGSTRTRGSASLGSTRRPPTPPMGRRMPRRSSRSRVSSTTTSPWIPRTAVR